MSDIGNTAIQVGPESTLEGNDAMAFGFLSRAANAIVQSSDLAKRVAELETKLDRLSHDFESVTNERNTLQNVIEDLRNERQGLQDENEYLRNELRRLNSDVSELVSERGQLQQDLGSARDSCQYMEIERDDWRKLADSTRESLSLAHSKIEKLTRVFREIHDDVTEVANAATVAEAPSEPKESHWNSPQQEHGEGEHREEHRDEPRHEQHTWG